MTKLNPLKKPAYPYDFAVGRSNPETFPIELVQQAAIRAIELDFEELTEYPGDLGHPALRAAMARRESEREGVEVDPDSIALMNGSMQAVTLVAEALTEPGDTIICEEFTYIGTINTYKALGIRMEGLPVDHDGMRVECFEERLATLGEEHKPKFIYALTTYQNPTGTQLSLERRRELIRIAQKHDIPLFEDNCYGDVHFDGEKPKALYALADYNKHIYTCSLSKILAPGVRLGYLMAQQPLFDKLLARKHDAGSNYLAAGIVAELYRDDVWQLTEELNVALKRKKNLVVDGLDESLADLCKWSNPAGGMFVWVRFPADVDQAKLLKLTEERGFRYQAGENFHVDGDQVPYLRLAFGHVPDQAIRDGIPVLAQCLRECRTSNEAPEFDDLYD